MALSKFKSKTKLKYSNWSDSDIKIEKLLPHTTTMPPQEAIPYYSSTAVSNLKECNKNVNCVLLTLPVLKKLEKVESKAKH